MMQKMQSLYSADIYLCHYQKSYTPIPSPDGKIAIYTGSVLTMVASLQPAAEMDSYNIDPLACCSSDRFSEATNNGSASVTLLRSINKFWITSSGVVWSSCRYGFVRTRRNWSRGIMRIPSDISSLPCRVRRWRLYVLRVLNFIGQSSQWYGVSPVWRRRCSLKQVSKHKNSLNKLNVSSLRVIGRIF